MEYFVLKIVSYSHATTQWKFINKQSANSSTERKLPTVHPPFSESQAPKAAGGTSITVISLQFRR